MKVAPDRGGIRLGVIVPFSNANLEPDMVRMKGDGMSVHFMRAGGYEIDQVPDSEQMRKFADASLEPVLEALCAVRPHGIVYGCTSATLSHGPAYDRQFSDRMESIAGVPCVTAAGSLVDALGAIGARRIGFGSPYTRQLNREGVAFLEDAGMEVVNVGYIGEDLGNYGQSMLEPARVFDLGKRTDHADADAVVLSCTDMRAVETIEELEASLGKPVISSNQASMFAISRRLSCAANLPGALSDLSPRPPEFPGGSRTHANIEDRPRR